MEKSAKCKCLCNILNKRLNNLELCFSFKEEVSLSDEVGNVVFTISNGPVFRDYFTSIQLIEISQFVRRYSRVSFYLEVVRGDAIITLFIPLDL